MVPIIVIGICLLITLGILLFDLYLYYDKIPGNTITQIIIELTKKTPMTAALIGLFMGILLGHFFG